MHMCGRPVHLRVQAPLGNALSCHVSLLFLNSISDKAATVVSLTKILRDLSPRLWSQAGHRIA